MAGRGRPVTSPDKEIKPMESKPMRTRVLPVAVTMVTALGLAACNESDGAGSYGDKTVCVDQYATATVIDDLLAGLQKGLADAKEDGLKVEVENPNADAATEQTLAQKFINDGCDVVVPVGTAAAQLMATAIKDSPIIFSGSSTPVEAKLVESMEEPGGNVTGVADVIDPVPDIDAMTELLPEMDTVGMVWKLGDPAGEAQAAAAKKHLDELGIKYIPATITNGSEITQATESLVGRVDAIEIPGDTGTISAIGGLMKVADDADIPVFGGTSSVVEAGGVLSSTYDYTKVGTATADLVLQVLDGADPAQTPVVVPGVHGLDLNETKLDELGIKVPDSVSDNAINTH